MKSSAALVKLLADVDDKVTSMPRLRLDSRTLDLDVVCAVVEAHLEQCDDSGRLDALNSITGQARLRLAVASLAYLLDPHDVIPDVKSRGLEDDVIVLRWASRMVRGELPV